jgi:hypothetical protein
MDITSKWSFITDDDGWLFVCVDQRTFYAHNYTSRSILADAQRIKQRGGSADEYLDEMYELYK